MSAIEGSTFCGNGRGLPWDARRLKASAPSWARAGEIGLPPIRRARPALVLLRNRPRGT